MSRYSDFKIKSDRKAGGPKVSRDEAIRLGLTRFWTGRECRNGHTTYRYTESNNCVKCQSERVRMYRARKACGNDAIRNSEARKKAEAIREQMALARELNDY